MVQILNENKAVFVFENHMFENHLMGEKSHQQVSISCCNIGEGVASPGDDSTGKSLFFLIVKNVWLVFQKSSLPNFDSL